MKDKKLNELKMPGPTIEEQNAYLEELSKRSRARAEQMRIDNPDVMEWIKDGRPGPTPELTLKYSNIMKAKELNDLKQLIPTIEEQQAFIDELSKRSRARTAQMKIDNPDVVEWIKDGKPKLTPELNIKYDNIMKAKELNDLKKVEELSISTQRPLSN